jgi:hypothetical protein
VDEEKHQAPRPAQVEWVFPKQAGPDVSSQPPVCVCDKDWCGSDRGSVFGVLRVDGSVGEGREWEEGFLAMRLLDSRSVQPQLEANLRWEPHRYLAGPAWEVVTVGTDQRRAMVDAVEPGLPPPPELGSVLVLREAKVTTVGVVSQLALPETRAVHLTTRWTSLKLCTGEACNDLRPKASGENQILLSLPGGSESLRHVVVEAEVDAHGLPRGVALSKKIVAQHFWTHAFGARKGEVESWKQAWRDWIREAFGDRASRQVVAERAETALADQILTLTELSEIYELCGEEGHVTTQ